jgi:hypothetical protein
MRDEFVPKTELEDYEPGATQEDVFEALTKVARAPKPPIRPKRPLPPPAPTSSET